MNVLLIYPDTDPLSIIPSGLINIEPLGLEFLAGDLVNHDVTILDLKVEKRWQRVIQQCQPDVVGITGTVVHSERMIAILEYMKQVHPTALTVVGGPHGTLVPDDFAASQVDDFRFEIPASYQSGVMKQHGLKMRVPGLIYADQQNEPRSPVDMENINLILIRRRERCCHEDQTDST